MRPCFLVACTLIASCACSVKPPPETSDVVADALPPTTKVRTDWSAPPGDTGEVDDRWIQSFGELELEALVQEAVDHNNPRMRLLASQVDRAAAASRLAASALKPTVGLGADISGTDYGGEILPDAFSGGSGGVGLGISWEADVWGRVRAGASGAEENLRATVADFEYARQSIAAQVAKAWFLATELKLQVALAEETVDILSRLTELVELQERVGQISMQDVYLIRADRDSAQEALRQAVGGQRQTQRALEILLGRYPAAEIETASEITAVPPPIPVGVPSDIIARRPDLVAAERRVAAAFFLAEEARLAKLPRFTLSAGVGAVSGLDDAIGQLAAGVFAPLYTGGALESQIDAANADQQAAIAAYGMTLLSAFEEVEGALTNEQLFKEREQYLESVVENNERAYDTARTRYDVGQTDLLSVIQIQAKWIGARVGLIRIQNERLAQRVNLHLALGGSFE